MLDIARYFDHHGWSCESPEPGLWRSTFFTESEEEFDLYVMVVDDWVHFAVTPFLPPVAPDTAGRLNTVLLQLNQQMRIAHFALDGDGDVSLLAGAPADQLSDPHFSRILEALVLYADQLAGELRRVAADASYHSPLGG